MIRTNTQSHELGCRRESGKIVLITLVVVIVLLVLLAMVGNLALTFRDKMETQNAADGAARSAGVWLARGLNGISACQHLEGELMAMIAIHHAIGGRLLLEGEEDEVGIVDRAKVRVQRLESSVEAAKIGEPATGIITYDQIKNDLKEFNAEATVIWGKIELMDVLIGVYFVKGVAGALEKIPYVQVVGYVLDGIATVIEVIALVEWKILQALESAAITLKGAHKTLLNEFLPHLHKSYAVALSKEAPKRAEKAAQAVASLAACEGAIFPGPSDTPSLRLPLVPDVNGERSLDNEEKIIPRENPAGKIMARSQLVRATWPYTTYHRLPILKVMRFMLLSRAAYHFRRFTAYSTVERAQTYYKGSSDRYQFMLEGYDPQPDKGFEPWTNNTFKLDQHFSVMGFAARKPRPTYAGAYLSLRPNPDGTVAFAQAQVYNANPQNRSHDIGGYQPVIGWDTLAWAPPPQGQGRELINPNERANNATMPKINLNWQVRLVPVSRLNEAIDNLGEPFNKVLNRGRFLPESNLSRTH